MSVPRPAWRVRVEEAAAASISQWPADLAKKSTNFFLALALEVGAAIDADRDPPGDPTDDTHRRYSLPIDGEPVLFEYQPLPALREVRITIVVWFA